VFGGPSKLHHPLGFRGGLGAAQPLPPRCQPRSGVLPGKAGLGSAGLGLSAVLAWRNPLPDKAGAFAARQCLAPGRESRHEALSWIPQASKAPPCSAVCPPASGSSLCRSASLESLGFGFLGEG